MKFNFCVACGAENKSIEHHHLVPKSEGGSDDETNLLSLCFECHGKVHGIIRRDIKKLTTAALKKAKERGVKLGSRNPRAGGIVSGAARRKKTEKLSKGFLDVLRPMIESGASYRKMAAELESRGVRTTMGKTKWQATSVRNLVLYLKKTGNV